MKRMITLLLVIALTAVLFTTYASAASKTVEINGSGRELILLDDFSSGTSFNCWTGGGSKFTDGKVKVYPGTEDQKWSDSAGLQTNDGVLTKTGQAKLANLEYLAFDIINETDDIVLFASNFTNAAATAAETTVRWTQNMAGTVCYLVDQSGTTEVEIVMFTTNPCVQIPAGFNGTLVFPVDTLSYWDATLTGLGFFSLAEDQVYYVDNMYGIKMMTATPTPKATATPTATQQPTQAPTAAAQTTPPAETSAATALTTAGTTASSAVTAGATANTGSGSDGISPFLIAGIAAAVLVIGAGAFYFIRKKRAANK